MEKIINKTLTLAIILGAMALTLFLLMQNIQKVEGSVPVSNEYYATTTDTGWSTATVQCKDTLTSSKVLGSVIITKTSNAILNIYDATSTTHSDYATSTIALFPLTTVGTYTFDVIAKRGICVVVNTTVGVASTTITTRP